MAGSNFQALATKLASPGKAGNVTAAFRPAEPSLHLGHVVTPTPRARFYGRPGRNTGPRSGLVGIGGRPGYKSTEPRYGRPRVTSRPPIRYTRTQAPPRV